MKKSKFTLSVLVLTVLSVWQPHAQVVERPDMEQTRLEQGERAFERKLSEAFNYDDPAGSEIRLLALSRDPQIANDIASLAEVLTQVARAQALQGRLEEAAHTLDRAASMPTEAVRPRVRLLIEWGRLFKRQGRKEDARLSLEKAYGTAVSAGQLGLATDAAHMLALIVPFQEARTWTDRGLALAERSSDPAIRHWVGVLENNWGIQLDEHGDHNGAALAFARSLASRRLENDSALCRTSEFSLAVQLRKLGLSDQALAIQERLEEEATSAKEPVEEILIERVENLCALNRKAEAQRAVEKALHLLLTQRRPLEQIERLRLHLKTCQARR